MIKICDCKTRPFQDGCRDVGLFDDQQDQGEEARGGRHEARTRVATATNPVASQAKQVRLMVTLTVQFHHSVLVVALKLYRSKAVMSKWLLLTNGSQ